MRQLVVAHSVFNDQRRPCGARLTAPHAWALLELLHQGPMTITGLTARMNIDRSNVSRLCAQMENAGEVERQPHPNDSRARLLRLTAKGEALAHTVDTTSAAYFAKVLARLEQSPSEITSALHALSSAMNTEGCKP